MEIHNPEAIVLTASAVAFLVNHFRKQNEGALPTDTIRLASDGKCHCVWKPCKHMNPDNDEVIYSNKEKGITIVCDSDLFEQLKGTVIDCKNNVLKFFQNQAMA